MGGTVGKYLIRQCMGELTTQRSANGRREKNGHMLEKNELIKEAAPLRLFSELSRSSIFIGTQATGVSIFR